MTSRKSLHTKGRICQIDVMIVFLNGYLEESIYIEQPEGFKAQDQE